MPKPEMEFWDPFEGHEDEWTSVPGLEKVTEIILAKDDETGSYTRLLKFAPGADTSPAGVQRHDFWEEILIHEGAIHDLTLDETFAKGQYACRPPGMAHGPWVSPEGCITFEVRTYER
jgi:hypothetical protein